MIQVEKTINKVVKKVKEELKGVRKNNFKKENNVISLNKMEVSRGYNYKIGNSYIKKNLKMVNNNQAEKSVISELEKKYYDKYKDMEVKNKAQLELYKKNLKVAYSKDINKECELILSDTVNTEEVHKRIYNLLMNNLKNNLGFPLNIEVVCKRNGARMMLEITDFRINKYGYREPIYVRVG